MMPAHFIRYAAIAFLPSLLSSIACCFAAGDSLNLFIGCVFFAAILIPPVVAVTGPFLGLPGCAIGVTAGVAIVWLMPVHAGEISLWQWAACVAILLSFTLALISGGILLRWIGLPQVAAWGVITLLAIAWLSWPVWLSSSLAGRPVHWLVLCHPLLAINGCVHELGNWTEQQAAYGMTTLGQDIQYQLPISPWPAVVLHGAIAAVFLAASRSRMPKQVHQR